MFRAPLPTNTATLSGFSPAPPDGDPLSGAKHPDAATKAATQAILTMLMFIFILSINGAFIKFYRLRSATTRQKPSFTSTASPPSEVSR